MVQHVESVRDVQLNNYVGVWTLDFGGVIPGSEGSELSAAYMEERILTLGEYVLKICSLETHWTQPRPAVFNFSSLLHHFLWRVESVCV